MAIRLFKIMMTCVLIIIPTFTFAHVKWFTNEQPVKESIENILSPFFIILSIFIAIILALLAQLLPRITETVLSKKIDQKLGKYRRYSKYILKYGTALALLLQITNGSIFAPEFKVTSTFEMIWIILSMILLVIPHHISTKLGAGSLLGLFIYVTNEVGIFHMLDYGFYLSIIGVLLIQKTTLEDWGFPFLYLGTGLSLCWVAVEKWVYPELTINIIQQHGVPTFGFPNEIFIVIAAFIEFIVGYLLVVGILNRLLAVVVSCLFILTTMIFGYTEVVGHFIIHIILLIFIIEGVSFYDPPISIHKTKIDQMVFVFLNFLLTLATFLLIYYRFA
ncbi:DoxX family membrane protein [Bacillus sp. DJP31]|uniref:DoxX family membrane protein n=1 Tax=Bacillus sp. DJP31 TaxID=3409789 RepID=UPI003BB60D0A